MKTLLSYLLLFTCAALLPAQDFSRDLKLTAPRMKGDDVAKVQNQLLSLGFKDIGAADGWFGPKTEKAVKAYQELLGFSQNGGVDGKLWKAMFASEDTLLHLNEDTKAVNALSIGKYTKTQTDILGHSSEGASRTLFRDGNNVRYAEVDIYSEMGKVNYRIYPVEDRLLVVGVFYAYPAPFDIDHATIEKRTFYYMGKQTFEVSNGILAKVEYDSIGVLEIMNEK